jgi:uncharacterized protein YdaU (DUF1376 family)
VNYYPFHIGDYAAHTAHLEPMEDLAYRRLLDLYYLREGPLPAEVQVTAKLIRMRSHSADVESVLREFFDLTDEGWRHSRCDVEVAHMQDKQDKARESGKASARARKASAEQKSKSCSTSADETSNGRSTDVQTISTDVQLPTPTPTPTPTPVESKAIRAPRFDAQAHLSKIGIPDDLAADWIKNRKAKKAEVTKTVIDGIASEALKAGLSLDAALRECCVRGWAGFKADWLIRDQSANARASPQQSLEARNKAVAANWVPPEMRMQA